MRNISRLFCDFFCSFYHAFPVLCLALLSDIKHLFPAKFGGKGSLRPTYGHKKDKKMHNEKGDFHLPKGSLYSPFPIPAYQVLGKAKEYQAQRLLLALVSYMGKSNNAVFPSYTTISKAAGIGRNSIRPALDVLHEYGFLKSVKYPVGKQARSKYFIQFACWDTGRMNALAKPHKKLIARCLACGNALDRGDFAFSPLGKVHWGCGGEVIYLPSYREGRK